MSLFDLISREGTIRCINLLEREDRYSSSQEIFSQLGLKVNYLRVSRHPQGGVRGCFESHIQCLTEAYDAGAKYCLVFEDDAIPSSGYDLETLDHVKTFIQSRDDWDLFYLGSYPQIFKERAQKVSPSIVKFQGYNTHAYIASRRWMEQVKDLEFTGTPIDVYYSGNAESYGCYPAQFIQSLSESDIDPSTLVNPSLRQSYYRGVEAYAYHINIPLNLLLVLLVVGVIFLYLGYPAEVILILATIVALAIIVNL